MHIYISWTFTFLKIDFGIFIYISLSLLHFTLFYYVNLHQRRPATFEVRFELVCRVSWNDDFDETDHVGIGIFIIVLIYFQWTGGPQARYLFATAWPQHGGV